MKNPEFVDGIPYKTVSLLKGSLIFVTLWFQTLAVFLVWQSTSQLDPFGRWELAQDPPILDNPIQIYWMVTDFPINMANEFPKRSKIKVDHRIIPRIASWTVVIVSPKSVIRWLFKQLGKLTYYGWPGSAEYRPSTATLGFWASAPHLALKTAGPQARGLQCPAARSWPRGVPRRYPIASKVGPFSYWNNHGFGEPPY